MQVDIPVRHYGNMRWALRGPISEWVKQNSIPNYSYTGSNSWGRGFDDNGLSTESNVYIFYGVHETDSVSFKILFPECKVYCYGN